MKKFYFLAMMAMLALSTTSCQKDDFNDAPAAKTTLTTQATDKNSYDIIVSFTMYGGGDNAGTNTRAEAYNNVRKYYQNLLGSNATVGEVNTTTKCFHITGKNNKNTVVTLLRDASLDSLDTTLEGMSLLRCLSFDVYIPGVQVLQYNFKYSK